MNKLGFTETDLRQFMNDKVFDDFIKFMRGQAVSLIENEIIYYFCDVRRFCKINKLEYPKN
jgi:hypothetical protein